VTHLPAAHPGARFIAWVGFALGSLVSVAGNWLHAWLPADDHPAGWAPTVATQLGAAVWPVALLVAVEVLSRTPWQPGWHWTLVRVGGVGVVGAGSAVISYGHIHTVLKAWGYDSLGAGVGPLVIDGLMVVSGFALLAMSQHTNAPAASVVKQEPPAVAVQEPPAAAAQKAAPAPKRKAPGRKPPARKAAPTVMTRIDAPAPPEPAMKQEQAATAALPHDAPAEQEQAHQVLPMGASRTDQEVRDFITSWRQEHEVLPTPDRVKKTLSIGTDRAKKFVEAAEQELQEATG
jgi:hypothetical protein